MTLNLNSFFNFKRNATNGFVCDFHSKFQIFFPQMCGESIFSQQFCQNGFDGNESKSSAYTKKKRKRKHLELKRKLAKEKKTAKLILPRQFLGPLLKAINEYGFRFELTSLLKWSGLNSSASSPQMSLRRWPVKQEMITSVSFGITKFGSTVSSVQWRSSSGATGYIRSVSFMVCSK